MGAVCFALYLALGWVRWSTGRTGNYDLGIFAQAAQRWASGRLPGSSIRSVDTLFADHFSPLTLVYGVGWWVWPDPRSLIVVQALALAASAATVAAAAATRLALRWAVLLGLGAGFAEGTIAAATFDVHEVTLGTPLMAGLCWGLWARRRAAVLGCSVGLLLIKEDLGLTVMVAGGLWWLLTRQPPSNPQRRFALTVAGLGLVGFVLANAVVIWAAPDHHSPYLKFLFGATGNTQGLVDAMTPGGSRWGPVLLFALTAGVVGLRSPLALLAVPTLAWRAVSANPSHWQTYFHYDAICVPIAAFALLDVLTRQARAGAPPASGRHRPWVVAAVLAVSVAAWLGLVRVAAWQPWVPQRYRPVERMRDAAALARLVPPGAPVVAQQDLGPVVLRRLDVRMLASTVPARGRWVLLTATDSEFGAPQADKQAWLRQQRARPEVTVTARGEVLLVRLPRVESVELVGESSGG